MKGKRTLIVVLMFLVTLALPATIALAGGWVVITLDSLPGQIRAGEMVRLGFSVRQHGVRPLNDVAPTLSAVNQDTGERVTIAAAQVGETGHFELAMRFPEAGVWEWQIAAPPFPQEVQFEPLTVLPATGVEDGTPFVRSSTARLALRWSGAGLVGLAALLALLGLRRREEVTVPGSSV